MKQYDQTFRSLMFKEDKNLHWKDLKDNFEGFLWFNSFSWHLMHEITSLIEKH